MPQRYVCPICMTVKSRGPDCSKCGTEAMRFEFRHTPWTTLPYLLAGIAGGILLTADVTGMFLIIWFTFPLIILGLMVDHLCQKEMDRKALKKARRLL